MYPLSIPFFLSVEDRVLVFWAHLCLGGHLGLPPLESLERLSLFRESSVDCRHDVVNGPEP